jgi:hypothetical protein
MYIQKKRKVFSILLLVEQPSRMINWDSADSVELTSLPTLVVNGEHLLIVNNGADVVRVGLRSTMIFIQQLYLGFKECITV